MLAYFPAKAIIDDVVGVDLGTSDPEKQVSVPVSVLRLLIQAALENVPFEEDRYVSSYPDLERAWQSGEIQDLRQHFIEVGYFEGRTGNRATVDEGWYLNRYKDVALAVREGHVSSVQEHYNSAGEREWRAPNEAAAPLVQAWRNAALR